MTKGPGSRAAGLAMAFKLIQSAQARWRTANAPHLVALVRAGARFENGKLVERPEDHTPASEVSGSQWSAAVAATPAPADHTPTTRCRRSAPAAHAASARLHLTDVEVTRAGSPFGVLADFAQRAVQHRELVLVAPPDLIVGKVEIHPARLEAPVAGLDRLQAV